MLRDQLVELLEPVVTGLGYELWEVEYASGPGGGLLRLYIDVGAAGRPVLADDPHDDSAAGAVDDRTDVGPHGRGRPDERAGGRSDGRAGERRGGAAGGHAGEATDQGIALEDCERVSRAVSEALDAADPIAGHYTLEVSSPGLDRVLRTQAHFARFAGEQISLEMARPVEGRRRFAGRLLAVGDGWITLQLQASAVRLPIDDIHRARLLPEYRM